MTRGIWLVVSAMLAYGQAGTPRPVFEVASIKPSPPPDPMGYRVGTSGGPGTPDPGRWSAQNYSLKNLIYTAYNLKSYELAAPDWTNSERFDIVAKVPEGASRDDLRLMIQALLEDRFKLTFHREPKEMATYELVVARNGPKLKEPVPPAAKLEAPLPSGPLKNGCGGLSDPPGRTRHVDGDPEWPGAYGVERGDHVRARVAALVSGRQAGQGRHGIDGQVRHYLVLVAGQRPGVTAASTWSARAGRVTGSGVGPDHFQCVAGTAWPQAGAEKRNGRDSGGR